MVFGGWNSNFNIIHGEFASWEIFNLHGKIVPRSGARVRFPINEPLSLTPALRIFSVGGQKKYDSIKVGIISFYDMYPAGAGILFISIKFARFFPAERF